MALSTTLSSAEVQPTTRTNTKPMVLVVDPDESTRSVLEVALGRDGFEVWSAGSGKDGLALLTGRLPDVIVLESDLGGEEGFTFVAQVRGEERLKKIPVLLLARADDENVEAMADVVGVDDFIQKPAFARDVSALVRVELARRAGGALSFDAAQLPPVQLLRALLPCPRPGRLFLVNGRAEIRFRAGKIIDARFDGRGGTIDALVRALALTRGSYSVTLEPVNGFAELQCGLRELVELVMPRLQKWTRTMARSLPLDSRLAVDFSRLATGLKAMPDELNRVVQLFDGFRSTEQVVLDSPLTETLTLEVATRLYLMGVLTPAKGSEDELLVLRPMPRLFEPRASEAQELMEKLFAGTAEIRAEAAEGDDEDWYPKAVQGSGLDVAEPDGGWTSAPVPSVLSEGLAPDVLRQLDAFQMPMQVEPAQDTPAVEAAKDFVRSSPSLGADTVMELALMRASEGPSIEAIEDDLNARLMEVDAPRSDRQARIDTPYVEMPRVDTPAVEMKPLAVEPPPSRVKTPVLEMKAVEDDAAASFFAAPQAAAVETEDDVAEPIRKPRNVWPFIAAAILLGMLLVMFEARLSDEKDAAPAPVVQPVVVVTPPPSLPDIEEPEFFDEAALAPEPEAAIDISENLTEATKLYERGQYKKAISILEQAIVDDPKAVNAWNLLGLARYDFGDVKGARAAADEVLKLEPTNGRVQILLATLHFDANEKELGRAALQKYLELEPNGAHVDEAKALLK
ncbi:MAG: response regulator [Archangium sp.]